jgi:hypothetical protein
MALSRSRVSNHVLHDLAQRLDLLAEDFNEEDELRKRWSFDERKLSEWGTTLNQEPWFAGIFSASEILACRTLQDVVDLVFETQDRAKDQRGLLRAKIYRLANEGGDRKAED